MKILLPLYSLFYSHLLSYKIGERLAERGTMASKPSLSLLDVEGGLCYHVNWALSILAATDTTLGLSFTSNP
jgi:hypothetical protein